MAMTKLQVPMSVPPVPPPPPVDIVPAGVGPKHCGQCAAVKRLKVKGSGASGDGLTAWHACPCVACTTAQASASALAQVSLSMRSALKDDLKPRRLFDAPGGEQQDAEDLELISFAGELGVRRCGPGWEAAFRLPSPSLRPLSALDAPLRTPAGEQCEEIVDDETELANPPLTLAAQP